VTVNFHPLILSQSNDMSGCVRYMATDVCVAGP
jgi:hypothetical protein